MGWAEAFQPIFYDFLYQNSPAQDKFFCTFHFNHYTFVPYFKKR
jgi:hypothetical protein